VGETPKDWRTWFLVCTLAMAPPGAGTVYVGSKISSSSAVVESNTQAIQSLRLALEAHKVTELRLGAVEDANKDHEQRLRALERSG